MSRIVYTLLFVLLSGVGSGQNPEPPGAERQIVDRLRKIRELRTFAATLWPEFDAPQYDVPLLYYTDSVCYALNPTDEFRKAFGARPFYRDAEIRLYKTVLPDTLPFHMETQVNLGSSTNENDHTPLICCSSPEITQQTIPDVKTDSVWLPMLLHEYAHGFQYRQPEFAAAAWRALPSVGETELARYHKRYDWFGRAVKAENDELLAALTASDTAARMACIRKFETLRTERRACMAREFGDSIVRDEILYEAMEGMARYIEAQVGFRLGSYSEADDWLYDTDRSGYFFATGYNLVRLLDLLGIDKSRLYTGGIRSLETFLQTTDNN